MYGYYSRVLLGHLHMLGRQGIHMSRFLIDGQISISFQELHLIGDFTNLDQLSQVHRLS